MPETKCGIGQEHCCHLNGKVCQYLEKNTVPGRTWACGLLRELGTWEKVYWDSRYIENIRPFFDGWKPELDCGTWPPKGETCAACGEEG